MKKYKIDRRKIDEYPKFPVGFGSATIMLPYPVPPREGVCDVCTRSIAKGQINRTNLHHWKYEFKHNAVKKDPFKVLKNLNELCFTCHKFGDALRTLFERTLQKNLWMIVKAAILMPDDMKKKMDWVCRSYLEARKSDKKTMIEEYFKDE